MSPVYLVVRAAGVQGGGDEARLLLRVNNTPVMWLDFIFTGTQGTNSENWFTFLFLWITPVFILDLEDGQFRFIIFLNLCSANCESTHLRHL